MKKFTAKKIKGVYEAVVIGVSSGGMEALSIILPELPADFPLAVLIVQHLHPHSDNFFARLLNEKCPLSVKEADEKEPVQAGKVYIAPPNYHLLVEQDRTLSLATFEKVNYARPSVDVLFETAAEAYGAAVIGVILTGANYDGSQGLKKIKTFGGLTIVQDPQTAEAPAMPEAALKATQVDYVLSLQEIGQFLSSFAPSQNKQT